MENTNPVMPAHTIKIHPVVRLAMEWLVKNPTATRVEFLRADAKNSKTLWADARQRIGITL